MRENRREPGRRRQPIPDKTSSSRSSRRGSTDEYTEILDLQRTFGNRTVTRVIQRASQMDQLEGGSPLPGNVRSRIGGAYGTELTDVRLHTGPAAARIASEHNANALTVGTDIVFGQGRYRPGTLVGSALIAHELAHVAQQQDSQRQLNAAHQPASEQLERDANQSVLGGMLAFARNTTSGISSAVRESRPRMRTAIQVQRNEDCVGSGQNIKEPEYLGEKSIEALKQINRILESLDLLSNVIVYGSVVNIAAGHPADTLASGGYDVSAQAEALKAIPVIKQNRVLQVIDLHLLSNENDMNEEERKFWYRLRELFSQAKQAK